MTTTFDTTLAFTTTACADSYRSAVENKSGVAASNAASGATVAAPAQLVFKRYEIKYLLTVEQHDRLRHVMSAHMVPDEWGPSTICNVYYDTPSRLLIRRSLEHPDYKEKIRVRSYGVRKSHAPVFVELKKKFDGVVYKRRATMDAKRAARFLAGEGDPMTQIERELDFSCRRYGGLVPSAFIGYDREAFYGADDHDFRMTFDRRVRTRSDELTLTAGDHGELLLNDEQVLLEVKCAGAMPLWLTRFLSAEAIRKVSFSKYGTAYMRQLAMNRERALATVLVDTQTDKDAQQVYADSVLRPVFGMPLTFAA